jgi:hypothetical protein
MEIITKRFNLMLLGVGMHIPFVKLSLRSRVARLPFKVKNPNLSNFWRFWQWKMLVYFMPMWSLLRPFGLFCGHLVYFLAFWYMLWLSGIFFCLGMLYQEKSGNPGQSHSSLSYTERRLFVLFYAVCLFEKHAVLAKGLIGTLRVSLLFGRTELFIVQLNVT